MTPQTLRLGAACVRGPLFYAHPSPSRSRLACPRLEACTLCCWETQRRHVAMQGEPGLRSGGGCAPRSRNMQRAAAPRTLFGQHRSLAPALKYWLALPRCRRSMKTRTERRGAPCFSTLVEVRCCVWQIPWPACLLGTSDFASLLVEAPVRSCSYKPRPQQAAGRLRSPPTSSPLLPAAARCWRPAAGGCTPMWRTAWMPSWRAGDGSFCRAVSACQ